MTTQKNVNTNETPVTKAKTAKKFAPSDLIECRSVTAGELIYVGDKTGLQYTWSDIGDTTEVEYQDLHALQAKRSRFIVDPLFIIENDDLVEQWKFMIGDLYRKVAEIDLESIFNCEPEQLRVKLTNAPESIKTAFRTRTASMIDDGSLYDIRKLRVIDEVLGTEFLESLASK